MSMIQTTEGLQGTSAPVAVAGAAIALYLLLVPITLPSWPLGPHDAARLAQVFLGAVCMLALLAEAWTGPPRVLRQAPRGVAKWCLCLGFLAGLSIAAAPLPSWALKEIGLWASMAGVATVTAAVLRPAWLFGAAVAATLGYNVVVLGICIVSMAGSGVPRAVDLDIGYSNVRFLNHVQTVALPLLVAGKMQWQLPLRRALVVDAAVVTSSALLFASAGRATAFAVVAAAVVARLMAGPAGNLALKRILIAGLMGYALYAALFIILPFMLGLNARGGLIQRVGDTASVSARFYLWGLARDLIERAPWLGVGPMHFAHHPNTEAAHPHNVYLQVASEFGLPFFAVAMAGLWKLGRAWVCRIRSLDRTPAACEGAAWLTGGLAVAFDGMASGNFVMPVSQVWIGLLAGFALRWWRESGPSTNPRRLSVDGRLALFGVALMACLLVWLVGVSAVEVAHLDDSLDASRALSPGAARSNPRYWSSGWF